MLFQILFRRTSAHYWEMPDPTAFMNCYSLMASMVVRCVVSPATGLTTAHLARTFTSSL